MLLAPLENRTLLSWVEGSTFQIHSVLKMYLRRLGADGDASSNVADVTDVFGLHSSFSAVYISLHLSHSVIPPDLRTLQLLRRGHMHICVAYALILLGIIGLQHPLEWRTGGACRPIDHVIPILEVLEICLYCCFNCQHNYLTVTACQCVANKLWAISYKGTFVKIKDVNGYMMGYSYCR
jgi:hypothetical protein